MVGLAPKLDQDGLSGPWKESRACELFENQRNWVVVHDVWHCSGTSFQMVLEPSFDLLLSKKK